MKMMRFPLILIEFQMKGVNRDNRPVYEYIEKKQHEASYALIKERCRDLCHLFKAIIFLFRSVPLSIVTHTGIYKQRNGTEQEFL